MPHWLDYAVAHLQGLSLYLHLMIQTEKPARPCCFTLNLKKIFRVNMHFLSMQLKKFGNGDGCDQTKAYRARGRFIHMYLYVSVNG